MTTVSRGAVLMRTMLTLSLPSAKGSTKWSMSSPHIVAVPAKALVLALGSIGLLSSMHLILKLLVGKYSAKSLASKL